MGIFTNSYKWDVDRIQGLINSLDAEKGQLESDSQDITTFKSDVESAWKSVAGTNYTGRINVDEQEIKNIINRIDDTKSRLVNVKNTYYTAEMEIDGEIRSLSSRIIR